MKRMLLLIAVTALMFGFASCNKEKKEAQKYVGTYKVTSNVNYDGIGAKAGFTSIETGSITIALAGDDGSVSISGMFNTAGYVDDNGFLHMNGETHVGAGVGAGITFLGYDLAGVQFTTDLIHGQATLNDNGTVTWISSGTGVARVNVLGIGVNVDANVTYSNTAVRQ